MIQIPHSQTTPETESFSNLSKVEESFTQNTNGMLSTTNNVHIKKKSISI